MLHAVLLKGGKLVEPPPGSTFTSSGPNLCFDQTLEVHVWAFLVQMLENQIEELD